MSDSNTTAGTEQAPQPALEAFLGKLEGKEPDPATVNAAESQPAQKEAVEPDDEAPAEEAGEAEEKEQPKRPSFEDKNALERARPALRRDGVKVAVIDSLSHEDLIKWGNSRADAQSKVDDAFRQLGELRKEKETWQAKASEAPKESANTEPAEQPLDLTPLGKTLTETLADEGSVNAVLGVLKSLDERSSGRVKAIEAKFQGAIQEANSVIQRLAQSALRSEINEARRGLVERFPQLADDRDFSKVREKMEKLAPSGSFESIEDLMAESATIVFASLGGPKSNGSSKASDRRNGLPTTNKTTTPPKAMSKEDKAMAAWMELEKKHGL